ncbi:MAG: hypothetical protein U9O64_05785 [Campylobacterota bacterium]|nr:hypothetical protein [Campylobacterota bacterium]
MEVDDLGMGQQITGMFLLRSIQVLTTGFLQVLVTLILLLLNQMVLYGHGELTGMENLEMRQRQRGMSLPKRIQIQWIGVL